MSENQIYISREGGLGEFWYVREAEVRFQGDSVSQLNLFDELGPKPNSEALMKVLDEINNEGRG